MLLWLTEFLMRIYFLLKNNESRDLIEEMNSIEVSLIISKLNKQTKKNLSLKRDF